MRVGYVLKKFPRLSETFILREILALEERGLALEIFSRRKPDEGRFHPSLGRLKASVRYLPEFKPHEAWNWLQANREGLGDAFDRIPEALGFLLERRVPEGHRLLAEALFVLLEGRRAGIEHFHAHFATGASILLRLVHLLGGPPYSFTAHAKDLYRHTVDAVLFRDLADGARFVVTVCEANLHFIRARLYPAGATPVLRLYNGVDLGRFRPAPAGPARETVVGIGRLIPKKGFRHLVEACAILRTRGRRVRCLLLGEGEERDSLERSAAEAGLGESFEFQGAVTEDEVLEGLHGAAVLCAPCVVGEDGNQDALPTVLLEALASGVPAITTPIGGVPEIVRDGIEGRLVPAGDAQALAGALEELLSNPALRARMGRAGRERAGRLFDLRRNAARLASLFEESIRGAPIGEAAA